VHTQRDGNPPHYNNSMDHNLNRLITNVTIYSGIMYVFYCASYSGVSVHQTAYCEFSPLAPAVSSMARE
jgi:hypothetical protein